jgi:hypothetical protein
LLHDELNQRD